MTQEATGEDWENEFEKQFPPIFKVTYRGEKLRLPLRKRNGNIKVFIRQLLSRTQAAQREGVERICKELERNDIAEAIQNSEGAFHPSQAEVEKEEAWNSALKAVLSHLPTSNKEKI